MRQRGINVAISLFVRQSPPALIRQYFDIVTLERGNLEQRQSRHQRFVADMTLELQSVRDYFDTVKGNLRTLRTYGASALDETTEEDLTAKTDAATASLQAAERELHERKPDLTDTARLEDMLSELAQMVGCTLHSVN